MKHCIVNADDFGAGRGINRGIAEAHQRGVVTSTSLMVNMPGSWEAATLAKEMPLLGVGLHVNLTNEGGPPVVDLDDPIACRAEIESQWRRFVCLMGAYPTHLDVHHNLHRDPRLAPIFVELARSYGVPLREHSQVRYFPSFYGQWDGESHFEQVSVPSLLAILESGIGEGFTELGCHPGLVTDDYSSSYAAERVVELETLCDPRVRRCFDELDIRLVDYRDVARLSGQALAGGGAS